MLINLFDLHAHNKAIRRKSRLLNPFDLFDAFCCFDRERVKSLDAEVSFQRKIDLMFQGFLSVQSPYFLCFFLGPRRTVERICPSASLLKLFLSCFGFIFVFVFKLLLFSHGQSRKSRILLLELSVLNFVFSHD